MVTGTWNFATKTVTGIRAYRVYITGLIHFFYIYIYKYIYIYIYIHTYIHI